MEGNEYETSKEKKNYCMYVIIFKYTQFFYYHSLAYNEINTEKYCNHIIFNYVILQFVEFTYEPVFI